MFDLEYLKKIQISEIVNKTHLDKFTIKAILEKDFEKLLDVNVKMNIKILEREYNVDFEGWLNEFNAYKNDNFIQNPDSFKIKPKVLGYECKKERRFLRNKINFLLIILLALLFYFFYFSNEKEEPKENTKESLNLILNSNGTVEKTTNNSYLEEKTKANLDESVKEIENSEEKNEQAEKVENKEQISQEISENDSTKEQENQEKIDEKIDENLVEQVDEKVAKNLEENTEINTKLDEKNAKISTNLEAKEEEKSAEKAEEKQNEKILQKAQDVVKTNKLFLNPKKRCWVSIKDLKSKKTQNFTIEKGLEFEKDSLIFLGHHMYNLELNGKKVKIPGNDSARYLLFKDGKVRFLSQAEYSKINKAK